MHPYELQRPLLLQGLHTIIVQETNEVVGDIVARDPLEVESPRQSPGPGKGLPKRRAQRQNLPCFDLLDVRQDERPELDGEIAKAGVQVVHIAAIRTATRGWVVMTALRRLLFAELKFSEVATWVT